MNQGIVHPQRERKGPFSLCRGMSLDDLLERIALELPHGGLVKLSGLYGIYPEKEIITVIQNPSLNSYEKADFDVDLGQPVPNGEIVDISRFAPNGLITKYFVGLHEGGARQFAGFLPVWLEFIFDDVIPKGLDLVEISRNIGDSRNRYFAVQRYRRIENQKL